MAKIISQRTTGGISPFHNRTTGQSNCNVWTTKTKGGDDDLEEKMEDTFCQTLNGHLGGYSYVTEPTPNTFTVNVPVKLNKDTYWNITKVTNTLILGCRKKGKGRRTKKTSYRGSSLNDGWKF